MSTVVPLCLKVPEEASSNTYKHLTDASSPTATVHALLALLEAILCPGAYSEPALAGSANSGHKQKAPQQGVKPASSAAAKPAGMRLLSSQLKSSDILQYTGMSGEALCCCLSSRLMRVALTFALTCRQGQSSTDFRQCGKQQADPVGESSPV